MAQLLFNKPADPGKIHYDPIGLIYDYASVEKIGKFILILPTGKLVRHYKQILIRHYFEMNNSPCDEPQIFNLSEFIRNCHDQIFNSSDYRLVSDAYRLALFEDAVRKSELEFFRKDGMSPSVLERISQIIYGLKEDGILPENLAEDLRKISAAEEVYDPKKLSDIHKIYSNYEELLNGGLTDAPGMLFRLNSFIAERIYTSPLDPAITEVSENNPLNRIFKGIEEIMFFGFTEFKHPEIEFLEKFAHAEVPCSLSIDYSRPNGPLFGNLQDTVYKLQTSGFTLKNLDDEDRFEEIKDAETEINAPRTTYLRRCLFNTVKNIPNPEFSGICSIVAAETRIEEVKSIAKLVKHLIINEDIPPQEICITMRSPDSYSELFREVFPIFKIPVNISDRFQLSKSAVITAIFSVLDIYTSGYTRERLQRALQSPYLRFRAEDGSRIDVNRLYLNLVQNRIDSNFPSNAEFWIHQIELTIKREKSRLEYAENDPENEDNDTYAIKKNINELEYAKESFAAIAKLIPAGKKPVNPAEFLSIIEKNIIKNLDIEGSIPELYENLKKEENLQSSEKLRFEDEIEKDARALSAFRDILNEMVIILKERHGSEKYNPKDLSEKLKTVVSGTKYQIIEKQNFGVNITSIEQTRGIPYRVIILCGALDGEFPISYVPERFLGKELKYSEQRHNQGERMQFYQFLTNGPEMLDSGNKKIYIFYPQSKEDEQLIRSPFIDDLLKITTLEEDGKVFDLSSGNADGVNIPDWVKTIANAGEFHNYYAKKRLASESAETPSLPDDIKLGIKYIDYFLNNRKAPQLEGILDIESLEPELINKLKRFSERRVSVSDLDTYASCPYKFFGSRVLRISEEEIPEKELSPQEMGSLLHLILYRFYRRVQEEQIEKGLSESHGKNENGLPPLAPVKLETSRIDEYRSLLHQIAAEEIDIRRFDQPFFELNENEIMGTESKRGLLDIWLDNEFDRLKKGWVFYPSLFEFSFGRYYRDNKRNSEPVELHENIKLSGIADRIEYYDGEEEDHFFIIDYKSSFNNVKTDKNIKEGKGFQMPLYILAVKKILNEKYGADAEPAGSMYISLRPKYDSEKNKFDNELFTVTSKESPAFDYDNYPKKGRNAPKTQDEAYGMLYDSLDYAVEIVKNIAEGKFPAEPDKGACDYCGYKAICRINENKGL